MNLPPHLVKARDYIRQVAESYGLDCYETIFEMLTWEEMNEIASYSGFPVRYPHWRFGMEYEQLSKSHAYGLSRIYELVINNDPCYAYLQESNEDVDQKLVMAHVYGHCDFFKNNIFFAHTNRKMIDTMANHGTIVRRHMDRLGREKVEEFLDLCLSLENLIDPNRVFLPTSADNPTVPDEEAEPARVRKMRSKEYLDSFVNPPEFLEAQQAKLDEEHRQKQRIPDRPERDLLLFLVNYGPLERWQQDILEIVRAEAYYFLPQMQTKIMNEGWASYWHSRIMTEKVLDASEVVDYADKCSGVFSMPPGQFNPYKVGLELWRDIERRWDRGQFGKDWEECDDYEEKLQWDLRTGKGQEKIFEVRTMYNDITFIDAFLTADFCDRVQLFVHRYNERTRRHEISDREFWAVKQQLLFQLTNHGSPILFVTNANHANRGELLLEHDHQGADLDLAYAEATLGNLQKIWKRPVHVVTMVKEKPRILSHDGEDFKDEAA